MVKLINLKSFQWKQKLSINESLIVIGIVLVIAVCSGFIGFELAKSDSWWKRNGDELMTSDLKTTVDLINTYYDGNVGTSKLVGSSIRLIVQALNDPNSYYLTSSEYKKWLESDNGQMYGFGFAYRLQSDGLKVLEVFPDTPAEKMGVKRDQVITTINSQSVVASGSATIDPRSLLASDNANLVFSDQQSVNLTRANYELPVVTSRKLSETTTYIKIYRFHGDFDQQLAEALHQITDSAKTKVIIDLRNNLGGETDLAISVADKFIPNGIIVEEKLKNKNEDIVHKASGGAAFKNIKVIVLTNTETASGAEILAAAIKDNHRGTLVGEKTYGKGTTGQFFGLPDGSAVHLTVGKWYRANGETIQGRGVIPDVEVEDALMNGEDQILKKAMEL